MSIIAQALGDLFFIVKICGGAYLIFLGIRIWIKEPALASNESGRRNGTVWANFVSGLIITLSNPKVILFYCGFLPTFLDMSTLTVSDLAIVVAIVTTVLATVLSTYALLASRARRLFMNQKAARRFNMAAGGVMVATGVAIAARTGG